jgi:RNA polymerase sigma-70 factor, ECF subfamily
VNHCLNWKRKWKRRFKWHHQAIESENDISLSEENTKSPDPERLIQEKQTETNLMNAIKTLPEKIRLVFVLSTFEGLSYQEIADTLKIKKGTVSSRLCSARTLLMDVLDTGQ